MADVNEERSRVRIVLDFIKRLLGRKLAELGDPHAYVMAPVRRRPKGRTGTAVAEIEDDAFEGFPPRG